MATILIVEDNPQNLKLATILLRSDGHTVIGASDAVEAERALGETLPDLLLVDMSLPGKDGYALTRELRAEARTAHLPILGLSALAMPGDAQKALAAGCSEYMTKPIRRAQLLERVKALLAQGPAPEPPAPSGSAASTSFAASRPPLGS
jgi:two-component system, cell cycle response regulator DivK